MAQRSLRARAATSQLATAPAALVALVGLALLPSVAALASPPFDVLPFNSPTKRVAQLVTPSGDAASAMTLGPALLSKRLSDLIIQRKNGTVFTYLDGLDIRSEEGTSVEVCVTPPGASAEPGFAKNWTKFTIGSVAGYADNAPGPNWVTHEVNDTKYTAALRTLAAHVRKMEKAKRPPAFELVLIVHKGRIAFHNFTLSAKPLASDDSPDRALQPKAGAIPVASPPACDLARFHRWEVGKLAENCMDVRACVTDERLRDLSCGGKPNTAACMRRCVAAGLEMIGRAYQTKPPDFTRCIECIGGATAKYVETCGDCPGCPPESAEAKRCAACYEAKPFFAACLK